MVFTYTPGMVDVTLTVIKQVELGLMVALLRVREPAPLAAVREGDPQLTNVGLTGFANTTPAGRASV